MKKIIWANFLHIYQPPNQSLKVLKKVTRESYRKIINILNRKPEQKITLNLTASLTEQLVKAGLEEVIKNIKLLLKKGQLELTETAKYHPILPLIPKKEIIRQIRLNNETNKKYLGSNYKPKGFFLPEMCYSKDVAKIIKKLGFNWIILDEIAYKGRINQVKFDRKYIIKKLNLSVLFRNRIISDSFFTSLIKSPSDFLKILKKDDRSNDCLITALDGENFGHHQKGMEKVWKEIIESDKFKTITISELLKIYKTEEEIEPINSSWSSEEEDLGRNPYGLWFHSKNLIHKLEWQLTFLVLREVERNKEDLSYKKARSFLDQALSSDKYWWSSAEPWWQPVIIKKECLLLLKTINLLNKTSFKIKKEARKIYQKIINEVERWQKEGYALKKKEAYLKKISYKRYFGGKKIE